MRRFFAVAAVVLIGVTAGLFAARVIRDTQTAAEVARVAESEENTACLVRELARTFVAGVEVLLTDDDDPAAVDKLNRLRLRLRLLERAVEETCPTPE